jgi:uncharacterized membrane protein YkvA (DUF1232 family)
MIMIQKFRPAKRRDLKTGRISFIMEIFALYYGVRDSRTPFYAKLVAFSALVYLVSPIDLIPDFIPVAGYLDDLVIVPLLLHTAYAFLPAEVKESSRAKAKKHAVRLYIALIVSLFFLLAVMVTIFSIIKSHFQF